MTARDDHPALPLILAMTNCVLSGGAHRHREQLADRLARHGETVALDEQTPRWAFHALAALPEVAAAWLDGAGDMAPAEFLKVMDRAAGLALSAINMKRHELNAIREAMESGELPL